MAAGISSTLTPGLQPPSINDCLTRPARAQTFPSESSSATTPEKSQMRTPRINRLPQAQRLPHNHADNGDEQNGERDMDPLSHGGSMAWLPAEIEKTCGWRQPASAASVRGIPANPAPAPRGMPAVAFCGVRRCYGPESRLG